MILRLIGGILFIVAGGGLIVTKVMALRRCTEQTVGTMVGLDVKRLRTNRRTRKEYHPVLEYTANGTVVRGTADINSVFKGRFKEGSTYDIRYNPEKPEEFVIRGRSLLSALLGGGFLLALGILILVVLVKK